MNIHDMKRPFNELISLADAAKALGVDSSAIRHAIASGRLQEGKHCAKYGKQWVLHKSAFLAFQGNMDAWNRFLADAEKQRLLENQIKLDQVTGK